MRDVVHGSGLRLELDGRSLTIDDVVAFARREGEAVCTLSDDAWERVEASCALKRELIGREVPIYGVTTGFGDSAHRQISPQKAARLQQNMLRFLGCGTGPIAPPEVTRAMMLLRANCLARGNSGVRPEVVERLLLYLNEDILPLVPERGSCGASGDLIPLSYLGAALVGEEDVLYEGEVRPSREVLADLGLEPLELEAKEGLALTNGTSFITAIAALAVRDAEELALVSDLCTAMASEALLGNRGHFNAFIHENKPHPGQKESAHIISSLLADSHLALDSEEIFATDGLGGREFLELERQVQDRYSIRCAPYVSGALRDTLDWVRRWVEIEMNSSDDNPLFDAEGGRVQSGGNFYAGHMAQAMDSLKVALANLCDLMDRQLELLVDEKFNAGLTPNLIPYFDEDSPEAGLHHGFKGMQLCSSAMTAEAMKLSAPASVHSRSTECHNQDKVSMGAIAARDARSIVELTQNIAAIHLIAACQALELRGEEKASPKTRRALELVRSRVPFLEADRRMDEDIEEAAEIIRSGALSEVVSG
ncbi:MAG: aromatic amino acid ammonia-lyase [Rubrobacteraceae bacterium]|uniref:HAL/PAL/TAL family ammonia-lyase n=1 Tax=Rubrobacter naiadicus TaxID=1392641 RepID=UPI00235EDF1E|nr:aromatic amino acid ammonia-lyase [Rubrobacter naiadicus]MBX6763564.1 aromatic amino acid lyase [Rubrobacteraceae bacterium]MCL6439579.1 aromatic amino acid ammonia-lyase [Rubrobacteraceae bacterium]